MTDNQEAMDSHDCLHPESIQHVNEPSMNVDWNALFDLWRYVALI